MSEPCRMRQRVRWERSRTL